MVEKFLTDLFRTQTISCTFGIFDKHRQSKFALGLFQVAWGVLL